MEEEDYIHSNSTLSSLWCSYSCCNGSKAAAIAALSFSPLSCTHSRSLTTLSLCSQIIASFIGKHGEPLQHICQHGGVNKALNQATISGTNGATTCLVVGYCHKWQYPNTTHQRIVAWWWLVRCWKEGWPRIYFLPCYQCVILFIFDFRNVAEGFWLVLKTGHWLQQLHNRKLVMDYS